MPLTATRLQRFPRENAETKLFPSRFTRPATHRAFGAALPSGDLLKSLYRPRPGKPGTYGPRPPDRGLWFRNRVGQSSQAMRGNSLPLQRRPAGPRNFSPGTGPGNRSQAGQGGAEFRGRR